MPTISIRQTIYLLIVAPLVSVMGLTGVIIFLGGRQIVSHVGQELSKEVTEHIVEHTRNYLERPHVILDGIQIVSQSKVGDLNNFPLLERYMWHLVAQDDALSYIFYGDEQGRFLGVQQPNAEEDDLIVKIRDESTGTKRHTYSLDERGQRKELISKPKDYEPRDRPWYQTAKQHQQSRWSSVYLSSSKSILSISPLVPVYNEGNLQGVLSIQISLGDISHFLQDLKHSRSLEAFIIDRQGKIIASSATESPSITTAKGERRLQAINSSEPIIKGTATQILRQFKDFEQIQDHAFFTFEVAGQRQLVQILPLQNRQSLDWLVAVAIPESNFMAPVYRYTQIMAIAGIGLSGLALWCALKLAGWIVEPINVFDRAAKDIEQEDYEPQRLEVIASRRDEFGQLGRVFQLMATVVAQRESSLKQQVEQLKQEQTAVNRSAMVTHLKIDNWRKLMTQAQQARDKSWTQMLVRQTNSASANQVIVAPGNEINLLRCITYLKELNDSALSQLVQDSDRLDLEAGQAIYRTQEQPAASIYLILSGEVTISHTETSESMDTLGFGELFGEISALLNTPRLITVKTRKQTSILSLTSDRFRDLLQQNNKLAAHINHNLREKIDTYDLKPLLQQYRPLDSYQLIGKRHKGKRQQY